MARIRKLASSTALQEHKRRGERFDFIRDRLAGVDILAVWEKLESELTIGAGRKNPEQVGRALDACESNLRRAGMIEEVARQELDEFDIHWKVAFSEWEWHAREALELAKKKKSFTGVTTGEMVERWIAAHIQDYSEWRTAKRDLERNRNMAKIMVSAWESRRATLRRLADLLEPRRGVDTSMLPRTGRGGENEHGRNDD